MKHRLRLPVIFLSALSILTSASVSSGVTSFNAPRIKVKAGTSTNWSGYAVQTNLQTPQSGVVTDVKGQWKVPSVTCGTATTYSSVWVGIDGYSDGTVEQTGTEQDCSGGQARYSAWYEMYPKFPVTLSMSIQPGNVISAEVAFDSNRFILTLTNLSTGASFSTSQRLNRSGRSSAEWIVEAPSSSGGVLPLANFETATISSASATISGHTGSISDAAWQNDRIDMVNSSAGIKAQTSALGSGGSSFSVAWKSSN